MTTITPAIARAMIAAGKRHNSRQQETVTDEYQSDGQAEQQERNRQQVYFKALNIFSQIKQISGCDKITVMAGNILGMPGEIYFKNDGGIISLYVFRQGKKLSENFISRPYQFGILDRDGWRISNTVSSATFAGWFYEQQLAVYKLSKGGSWGGAKNA